MKNLIKIKGFISKSLSILSFALFFCSCSPYNYISMDSQTPCFTEKKTFRTNLNLAINHLEISSAYSITSTLGICGSMFYSPFNSRANVPNPINFGAELGAIYYKPLFKSVFDNFKYAPFIDLNGGFGFGNCSNVSVSIFPYSNYKPSLQYDAKYMKAYIQSNLYFVNMNKPKSRKFQFGIGTKLNLCYYFYLKRYDADYSEPSRGEKGDITFQLNRSAESFVIPVQDFYIFLSKDFGKKDGFKAFNITLKGGSTIQYKEFTYDKRDVLYLLEGSTYLNDKEHSKMTDDLSFNNGFNWFVNLTLGFKL